MQEYTFVAKDPSGKSVMNSVKAKSQYEAMAQLKEQGLTVISIASLAAAHKAKFAEIVGSGGHVRFSLTSDDGARLKAIAFRAANTPIGDALLRDADSAFHFAGALSIDHYQGREQVQFRLTDMAKPKG